MTDTPTPRTDALIESRHSFKTSVRYLSAAHELARTLERDLTACRAALRAVVTNANGRRESGYTDVPWTTIDAARAILPPDTTGEGEGK